MWVKTSMRTNWCSLQSAISISMTQNLLRQKLSKWEEVGVNLKSKKFLKKSMNWKILHVKDTDWSNSSFWNRFRSQNFWHYWAFPTIQPCFNELVFFFPRQIEPCAHRGPVFKIFWSKFFIIKIIVSPLDIYYHSKKSLNE